MHHSHITCFAIQASGLLLKEVNNSCGGNPDHPLPLLQREQGRSLDVVWLRLVLLVKVTEYMCCIYWT